MEKITFFAKYSDFANIFLYTSKVKFPKYTSINNYFNNLINNK